MKNVFFLMVLFLLVGCSTGGDDDTTTSSLDDDSSPIVDDDTADDDDDDNNDNDNDTSPTDDDSSPGDDDASPPAECVIEGVTYQDGDVNPLTPCMICDPAEATDAWTNNDGVACDDGVYCNGSADVCLGGMCAVHSGDPCADNGLYCDGVESCDEINDQCISSGDPCDPQDACYEDTDTCSPDPETCYGAAWLVHDVCGYDPYANPNITTEEIEQWCEDTEAQYGKLTGVYFTCLVDCALEQDCSTSCMDTCRYPADPGTGCGHVVYEFYTCGDQTQPQSSIKIPGSDYYFSQPDAQAVCGTLGYDWECYQACYDDNHMYCDTNPGSVGWCADYYC